MRVQTNTHVNHSAKTTENEKISNGNFEKLLKNHIQPSGIDLLVKDAFSDIKTEIINEIENITCDETGHNIDMDTLCDLLELAGISN